jgi:hypothetical protein
VQRTQSFPEAPREAHADFQVPRQAGWYALIVEDQLGRKAYSDPIWTSDDASASLAGEAAHPW